MSQIAWYWWPRRSRGSQTCNLSTLKSIFLNVEEKSFWSKWPVYYFFALPARESQLSFSAAARKWHLLAVVQKKSFWDRPLVSKIKMRPIRYQKFPRPRQDLSNLDSFCLLSISKTICQNIVGRINTKSKISIKIT